MISKLGDRIEVQATVACGVPLALAEAVAAAPAVGLKPTARVEVQATVTGGVPLALAEAVAARLTVGI